MCVTLLNKYFVLSATLATIPSLDFGRFIGRWILLCCFVDSGCLHNAISVNFSFFLIPFSMFKNVWVNSFIHMSYQNEVENGRYTFSPVTLQNGQLLSVTCEVCVFVCLILLILSRKMNQGILKTFHSCRDIDNPELHV